MLAKQMGMHAQVATRQRVGQAEARAVNDPALTSTPCVVRSCMMQWLWFSPLALTRGPEQYHRQVSWSRAEPSSYSASAIPSASARGISRHF